MKTDYTVEGMEEALKNVPEEEREEIKKEIEELFKDFDPENPPGEAIYCSPEVLRECPNCGHKEFEFIDRNVDLAFEGKVDVIRCPSCDTLFSHPTQVH